MNAILVLIAVLMMLDAPNLISQIQWTPVPGPYGGTLSTLARDSAGTLYTAHSGLIYRSTDDGTSWQTTKSRPGSGRLSALLGTPDGALLAAYPDSIFRSTDRGATWSFVHAQTQPRLYERPLAVDATGNIYLSVYDATLRSTDDGVTWRRFVSSSGSMLYVVADDLYILEGTYVKRHSTTDPRDSALLEPPRVLDNLSAGPAGELWALTDRKGVYRSTDRGETWMRVAAAPTTVYSDQFFWVDEQTLLLTGGLHLFRTTDDGLTWDTLAGGSELFPLAALVGTRSGALIAIAREGIARSTDGGATWLAANQALRVRYVAEIGGDAEGHAVYAHMPQLNVSARQGLWRTTDNGAGWTRLLLPKEFGLVLPSWTVTAAGTLYVGTWGAIFRSTDRGDTWLKLLELNEMVAPEQIAGRGDTVFFVSDDSAYTMIGDNEWRRTKLDAYHEPVTVAIDSASGILLSTRDDLLRSTDGGATFQPVGDVGSFRTTAYARPMAVAPDGSLYMSRNDELLRVDVVNGRVERLPFEKEPDVVTALAFPSLSSVLVGTKSSGVRLLDHGAWIPANENIESDGTTALFANRSRAWAGTTNAGLFVTELTSSVSSHGLGLSDAELLHNVRECRVAVSWQPATSSTISVTLYDLRGRQVAVPWHTSSKVDGNRLEVDVSELPSGVYLLRLAVGERATSWVLALPE